MHSTLPMTTRPCDLDPLGQDDHGSDAPNVFPWGARTGSSAQVDKGVGRLLADAGVAIGPQAAPPERTVPERAARRVGVQVIADANGLAHGYELLYRHANGVDASGIVNGMHATCEVLAAAVLDLGLPRRARGLSFYINVDRETLMSQLVEAIRPGWGVVELLECIVVTPDVRERVRHLRQLGLRFALDDINSLDDSRWSLLDEVELIKIDWRSVRPTDLPQMIARARERGVAVLAEKVEDESEVALARAMGIELFQGHAIARPDIIVAPSMPRTSALALRRAWLLLQHGPSSEAVATALAFDPATALRVWQVAELDGTRAGTADRPHMLVDLVADLPRPILKAWLAVLQIVDAGPIDPSWTYAGLVQARLMKVLARRVAPDNLGLADEAFLMGLLDHFRTTLGIAYRDPDLGVRAGRRIEQAMREREGLLGALLEFAHGHFRQPTGWLPGPLAASPGLSSSLSIIYRESHLWARERSLGPDARQHDPIGSTWPELVRTSSLGVWQHKRPRTRQLP